MCGSQVNPSQAAGVIQQKCPVVFFKGSKLYQKLVRSEARAHVVEVHGLRSVRKARNIAAQNCFHGVGAIFEIAQRRKTLLAQRGGPFGAKIGEQAIVAAFESGILQTASPGHGRFEVAITQRGGKRSLAFEHGLPLIEALYDSRIRIGAEILAPIAHVIQNAAFAARDGFEGENTGFRKLAARFLLEGQQRGQRVVQIRKHAGLGAFRTDVENFAQHAVVDFKTAAIQRQCLRVLALRIIESSRGP